MLWELGSSKPCESVYRCIHFLLQEATRFWNEGKRAGNHRFVIVFAFLSASLSLLQVRFLSLGGKHRRRKASHSLQTLDWSWQHALRRPCVGATLEDFHTLVSMVKIQVASHFRSKTDVDDRDSVVYTLLSGNCLYTGMSSRRFYQRTSEHLREVRAHLAGTTPRRRRRRKYMLLMT